MLVLDSRYQGEDNATLKRILERTHLSNTEVWELMALIAWRLFYCSDIYIALYISKPVLFGSRFTNSIHVHVLRLTYVYVINRHICK